MGAKLARELEASPHGPGPLGGAHADGPGVVPELPTWSGSLSRAKTLLFVCVCVCVSVSCFTLPKASNSIWPWASHPPCLPFFHHKHLPRASHVPGTGETAKGLKQKQGVWGKQTHRQAVAARRSELAEMGSVGAEAKQRGYRG